MTIETRQFIRAIVIQDDMSVSIARQQQFIDDGKIIGASDVVSQIIGPNDDPSSLGLEDEVLAILQAVWSTDLMMQAATTKFDAIHARHVELQTQIDEATASLDEQYVALDKRRDALHGYTLELDIEEAHLAERSTAIEKERQDTFDRLQAMRQQASNPG